MQFVVLLDGSVANVRVPHATNEEFAAAAAACVAEWRFKPATRNGEPAIFAMQVPIVFRLSEN